MTREEAAERLEKTLYQECGCATCEAHGMGAAALRRLDGVEKWAKAWISFLRKRAENDPCQGTASNTHFAADQFDRFDLALNGEMTWPEEKPHDQT